MCSACILFRVSYSFWFDDRVPRSDKYATPFFVSWCDTITGSCDYLLLCNFVFWSAFRSLFSVLIEAVQRKRKCMLAQLSLDEHSLSRYNFFWSALSAYC